MFLQILGADAADPSAVLISITSATMIVGTVWSLVQRWNFALRLEALDGKVRLSVSVSRRGEDGTGSCGPGANKAAK